MPIIFVNPKKNLNQRFTPRDDCKNGNSCRFYRYGECTFKHLRNVNKNTEESFAGEEWLNKNLGHLLNSNS